MTSNGNEIETFRGIYEKHVAGVGAGGMGKGGAGAGGAELANFPVPGSGAADEVAR